jgi:ATP-dependent helicase HrpB
MKAALPIDAALPEIVEACVRHGTAVVTAPPGSGKTTRIPPALLQALDTRGGQILVLQPRRIAARAAARRIADENGWRVGGEVGYHVRFDRVAGDDTRLLVVTEGILTRLLQGDPALTGVAAVIIDEFHERSLHADLGLALLREVRAGLRPDLGIVVMSATLDAQPVARFLGGAAVIHAGGRVHPVEISYLQRSASGSLLDAIAAGVHRAVAETTADVLVFLPGAGEIQRCGARLAADLATAGIDVLPLHGDLPPEMQDRALQPGPRRRIVLATNVAETSLTIPGVAAVVDSGFFRQLRHDPRFGLDRLELRRISQASAEQRAGRAGRTAAGRAYRMWTPAEQRGLEPFDVPEILRVDLARVVLELRAWGIGDPAAFGWFEAPRREDLQRAEDLLVQLGALQQEGSRLTELGRTLLALPVHPRLGRLLVEAQRRGHAADGAVLAALLAERDVLRAARFGEGRRAPEPSSSEPSDLLMRLDRLRAAQRAGLHGGELLGAGLEPRVVGEVRRSARQLQNIAGFERRRRPAGTPEARETALLKAVLAAFPDRVVKRRDGGGAHGIMVGGRGVTLAPDSVVRRSPLLVAVRIDDGGRGLQPGALVRWASAIEPHWLQDMLPGCVRREQAVEFDEQAQRVTARERLLYRDLVLEDNAGGRPDAEAAARELAAAVRRNPQPVLPAGEDFLRLAIRVRALRTWHPQLALPALDEQELVEMVAGQCQGRRSFEELRKVEWAKVVSRSLSPVQRAAVEREAPEQLPLPSGRRGRIRYEEGRPPILSARIQDLFGLTDTPRLAGGRVACIIEILAPNQRPIQVTQDLASFWLNTYPIVRKELRRRYPRHDWPEKPPS